MWPFILDEKEEVKEISDIEVKELSLVGKAANKKRFLIIKSDTAIQGKSFERDIPIFISKADQKIVCGIVYEPDVVDSQGDKASEEEIRKAAFHFMENVRKFKVEHDQPAKVKVLESYIAPQDVTIAKQSVKKGSWVLTVRVLSEKLWKAVKAGSLTGFSMSGFAMRKNDEETEDPFPSVAMTVGGDLVRADDYEIDEDNEDEE